jgi:hypothetical protein
LWRQISLCLYGIWKQWSKAVARLAHPAPSPMKSH